MSSSLKVVTLALLSVNVSCLPGPDPGTYHISKTVWATENEVPSYGRKKVLWNSPLPTPFDDELKEELEEMKDENKELQTKLSTLMTKLDGLSHNFTKLENADNYDENVIGDLITAFNDSLTSLTIKTALNSKNIEGITTDVKAKMDNVTQDVVNLKASDQKQENRIVVNIEKLKSVSRHGKWCGYQDSWITANSIINYDSLKFSSSNMDITGTPLNINTGIFTVPMSGAWRVTFSMTSQPKSGQNNYGYIYFNNKLLPESEHHSNHAGALFLTGEREVTLSATSGDTIYFKTGTMTDYYHHIYFCVAFEHGFDPQSRFSARDEEISRPENQDHLLADVEDIPGPEYQDSFSADVEDIPGPKYQDHFSTGDEENFSTDLEKSLCSSNNDCPPHLACIRSVLSSDLGTCGDPWCWREEWGCGSGARCIIANHKPLCV